MAEIRIMGASVEEQEQVTDLIRKALAAYPVSVAVDEPRRLQNRRSEPGTPAYRIVFTIIPAPASAAGPEEHTVHVEREEPVRRRGEHRGGRPMSERRDRPALPPGTSG
ncbi:hypothetical protein OG897_39825 [Streptomyces sp. NBC_00237]|uniref:hypothetical protein n=1 Tax=Streptomyces sp. NBC_00237 TaxID=2975687 RepID=UPI002256D394|nr:hypothetical protein [Streptomyces sp. NBC_00237]MCX5207541.1 hypothetical protein [Streptomyces sp. NBC_00237]